MIEKSARKPSSDPAQEKLRQDKASWNKEVSLFLNDVIHLKKMMNGWPSKFFKERSRITQPIPADPATIISTLANDFQELAQRGESLVQEQLSYSKSRRQKQPKAPVTPGTPTTPEAQAPAAPTAPPTTAPPTGADLSKQLAAWETKYSLVAEASNPISRFITRLLTPTIGFGEGARIRRLRMTLLRGCVETLKALKRLQKEIVKSSDNSIAESHKIMTDVWNHWTVVARGFQAAQMLRPETALDAGGDIEMLSPEEKEEVAQQKALEGGQDPNQVGPDGELPIHKWERVRKMLADYISYRNLLEGVDGGNDLVNLEHAVDKIRATPKIQKMNVIMNSNVENDYVKTIRALNLELGTTGKSFKDITDQLRKQNRPAPVPKVPVAPVAPPSPMDLEEQVPVEELATQAQLGRWLGKLRHQMIPGATSGTRLEVYRLINNTKKDLNYIMNWLEHGWHPDQLGQGIPDINRQITSLRALTRSLAATEGPKHRAKERGKK